MTKNFHRFLGKISVTFDYTVHTNVSQLALFNGFELLSSFRYCPQNNGLDLVLQDFFISQKSPRALLQGTANLINSNMVVHPVNMEHLHQFCQMLEGALKLDLGYILSRTLSYNDIKQLTRNKNPLAPFANSTYKQPDMKEETSMAELSSHPVHLTSKRAPSAFIPFCAYQTDMLALGEYIEGLEFPVFTPILHRGQRCYTKDVSSLLQIQSQTMEKPVDSP